MLPDFNRMIFAHSRWKTRLKEAVEGHQQLDPGVVGKDDQCDLGHWLYGEGGQYAALQVYKDVVSSHAKFHACVANVIVQARSVSPVKALELIDPFKSEFGRASSQCINAIEALRATLSKG